MTNNKLILLRYRILEIGSVNLVRRVIMGLVILIAGLAMGGCGTSTGKAPQVTTPESKVVHLTPIAKDTPLATVNTEVSKQLMAQKDVTGTQIYEQKGILYGDITFKSGVAKDYAHNLANEFLNQLKVSYPDKQITTQVISDGKKLDAISFKPGS